VWINPNKEEELWESQTTFTWIEECGTSLVETKDTSSLMSDKISGILYGGSGWENRLVLGPDLVLSKSIVIDLQYLEIMGTSSRLYLKGINIILGRTGQIETIVRGQDKFSFWKITYHFVNCMRRCVYFSTHKFESGVRKVFKMWNFRLLIHIFVFILLQWPTLL